MHFNFLNNFTSNSSNVDTSKFGGESETISYLRFPLIVLVVMIHSKFDGVVVNGVGLMHDGGFPCYSTISTLVSNIIASIAVPLFYFISGFLFFFKTAFFSFDVYCSKIKKRAKLYLFLIYVGIYLLFCCCWLQKVFSRGYYQERISLW